MPVPTAYTEPQLAQYLHAVLGQTADALGLSPEGDGDGRGSYREAIEETILAYGVAGAVQATDMRKLRALARREAWRLAAGRAAGEYDFSTAGSSFSRSQLRRAIAEHLALAEAECGAYDASVAVTIAPIRHVHDPYAVGVADDARVLP